jgi:ribosomal protein S18 acetylase RimI-like enzyme
MERADINIRWMVRTDLDDATRILRSVGEEDTERRINDLLEKPSVMCIVAEIDKEVVGVAIYEIGKVSKIKILFLAVDESKRRKGAGKSLVSEIFLKLNKKRNKVEVLVSEYGLDAHLFLKSLGFKAVAVLVGAGGASDYRFLYKPPSPSKEKA